MLDKILERIRALKKEYTKNGEPLNIDDSTLRVFAESIETNYPAYTFFNNGVKHAQKSK